MPSSPRSCDEPHCAPVSPLPRASAKLAKSSAIHQLCLWRRNDLPGASLPVQKRRRCNVGRWIGKPGAWWRACWRGRGGQGGGRQRRTGQALARLVQLWTRSTVASSTSLIRRLGRLAGAATSLRWSTKTEAAGLWTRPHLSRVECLRPSIGLAVGYDRPRGRPVELCLCTLVLETDMQRWGAR